MGLARSLARGGSETVLFVEDHRFTKAQQDALLPGVEPVGHTGRGHHREPVTLGDLAASLSSLLRLESLTDDEIGEVLEQALSDERGLAGEFTLEVEAHDSFALPAAMPGGC